MLNNCVLSRCIQMILIDGLNIVQLALIQVPEVYKLVEDCRDRGDNVAVEEFDDYEDWYTRIADLSWIFSLKVSQKKLITSFSGTTLTPECLTTSKLI